MIINLTLQIIIDLKIVLYRNNFRDQEQNLLSYKYSRTRL